MRWPARWRWCELGRGSARVTRAGSGSGSSASTRECLPRWACGAWARGEGEGGVRTSLFSAAAARFEARWSGGRLERAGVQRRSASGKGALLERGERVEEAASDREAAMTSLHSHGLARLRELDSRARDALIHSRLQRPRSTRERSVPRVPIDSQAPSGDGRRRQLLSRPLAPSGTAAPAALLHLSTRHTAMQSTQDPAPSSANQQASTSSTSLDSNADSASKSRQNRIVRACNLCRKRKVRRASPRNSSHPPPPAREGPSC